MYRTLLLIACVCLTSSAVAQQAPTSPADETRKPSAVRSPNSIDADLTVPLCPAQFHDGLSQNGIASSREANTTKARIISTVPALITPEAITAAGKSHIGSYNVVIDVVVDEKGNPQDICLEKSAGFGLDASAATAVRQYHFDAAQKDGKAIRMRLPVEVRFSNPNTASLRSNEPEVEN